MSQRTQHSTEVQVLGSGGPMHGEGRGSAAYLLWEKNRVAAVVDMGGDTPTALARVGVIAGEVQILLLTHLHADHVSGLPDFLWGEMTANRRLPLTIVGPAGTSEFPDITTFMHRMFGAQGAFAQMQDLLEGRAFPLEILTAPTGHVGESNILELHGLSISTYPVAHGKAPTIAYRIDSADFRIVFGSDQTGLDSGFSCFAAGSDILILHAMLCDAAEAHPISGVVALPRHLGIIAREARAKRLILGHLMKSTLQDKDSKLWSLTDRLAVRDHVAEVFGGKVYLANDLECFAM